MNQRRSSAYMSVIGMLDELGDAIDARDQDVIREAADTRLFAPDVGSDTERALRAVDRVLDRLVGEGRVAPWSADAIAADLDACGPYAPVPMRR